MSSPGFDLDRWLAEYGRLAFGPGAGEGSTPSLPPPPFPATDPSARPGYLARGRMILAGALDAAGRAGLPALHRVVEGATAWMRAVAGSLARGSIRLAGWFATSLDGLVARHYAGTLALTGGATPPPPALDVLDARIDRQAGYLARLRGRLAAGMERGKALIARAGRYGASIWGTAQAAARVIARGGRRFERRVLEVAAHHCLMCPILAAEGWVPIGTLPAIGDTPCQSGCRCWFEYR